jgi:sugar (pentulose or hexulose) kinase
LKYYLSVDAGTSIIKTVLFNKNFDLIFISSVKNKVITDEYGKSEIEMNKFWSLTSKCIKSCILHSKVNPLNIDAVGITGNMVGAWPIDKANKPLRNAILWNDTRSEKVFNYLKKRNNKIFENIFSISGSVVQYGCTLPIIKWLEINEKNVLKKIKYFLTCKDWIRFKLTNNIYNDLTERSVSPGDIKKISFSLKILNLLQLNSKYLKKFPEARHSYEIGGYVTNNASKQTGLEVGTPVAIGAGDVPSTAIGLGAIKKGMCSSIVGTTCHNFYVSDKPFFKPKNSGLLFYSPNKQWLRTMINVAGTTNFDWVVKNFYKEKSLGNLNFLSKIEKKFQNYDINKNDIIFLPYFNYGGTISPFFNLNAKAEIFGLLPHNDRDDILYASYQGLCLSIRDCYEALNIKVKSLSLSGGASKSKIFPQILSDVLGIKIIIPYGEEFGARGAAYLASVAIKKFKNLNQVANKNKKIKKIFSPNLKNKNYYFNKYQKYLKLRQNLANLW